MIGSYVNWTNYIKHEGDEGWIKIDQAYNKDREMI